MAVFLFQKLPYQLLLEAVHLLISFLRKQQEIYSSF